MFMRRLMCRRRGERGAVAVEAAIITPVLALFLFGIIEMSLLMRDTIATTSSVRVGARIASVSAGAGPGVCQASANPPPCSPANTPALAQAAADAIQRGGSAMPKDQIQYILVYRANPQGYPLPSGNTSFTCAADCVKYTWDAGLNKFRYSGGSWVSTTINACVNHADRQSVGVAMVAKHDFITGLIGSTVTLHERTVMQFEPLPSEQCMPGTHL
ncbi:MAG: pilus assembly protein [Nocardioides sp.]